MAANDFLSGFRTGADAYNQARALRDRRDATKQQGEFDKLRLKLEEERNALTKQGLDDTAAFREKSLAEQVASREDASKRDNARIKLQESSQAFNESARTQELLAKLEETSVRNQLTQRQIDAMDREQEIYDKLGPFGQKIVSNYDAYNQAVDQKTYYLNVLSDLTAAGATGTPEFSEAERKLAKFDSLSIAAAEDLKQSTAFLGSMLASQKLDANSLRAAYDLVAPRNSGRVGVQASRKQVINPLTGETVTTQSLEGTPEELAAYPDWGKADPNADLGGSLNPQTKPKTTPGQASAFSVLNLK